MQRRQTSEPPGIVPERVLTAAEGAAATGTISRTQMRVLRTIAAIERAFVDLVLEQGYDQVTVDDIASRADIAKATFYAHYENKEALLSSVFSRLIEDAASQIRFADGPWTEVRPGAVEAAYRHAHELRDLYQVCLRDSRARAGYADIMARFAEENFLARLTALGREPRIPVKIMAKAFAGAHMAILESWLDGEISGSEQEVAAMELDLLIGGMAWGHNISPTELGYSVDPPPAGA
jgi:AcrR family transcriptional regulator